MYAIASMLKNKFFILFIVSIFSANCFSSEQVRKKRSINGTDSTTQYEWIVALLKDYDRSTAIQEDKTVYDHQFCGGVLLDSQWVATAAHCVENINAKNISVAIGALNLNSEEESNSLTIRQISRIVTHPQYYSTYSSLKSMAWLDNDIALLKLKVSVTNQPIALIDEVLPEGTELKTTGWGVTGYKSMFKKINFEGINARLVIEETSTSPIRQEIAYKIKNTKDCRESKFSNINNKISKIMMTNSAYIDNVKALANMQFKMNKKLKEITLGSNEFSELEKKERLVAKSIKLFSKKINDLIRHEILLNTAQLNNAQESLLSDTNQVCVESSTTPVAGICYGDSGSPLFLSQDGEYKLIGLASFSKGCAAPNSYDVFSNIYVYRNWIQNAINN
ncbi:S1 family peptidase [Zooshikella harenae]|uniref:Serine protease n=1 Tax=Zooshikella harenae TaxID=2827238 RepID=A0ABS5ZH41_9GAMM|nr:serine protease [Zooshikella harenae]MBU2713309.1 serine protease [Zooshikella harenae]